MRLNENKLQETGLGMSNYDHEIDKGFEKILRKKKAFGRHSGWNFNGMVWFENSLFCEEVWVYGVYKETISAKTLKDLMQEVNDIYGWE